jgi:hypothetical protein
MLLGPALLLLFAARKKPVVLDSALACNQNPPCAGVSGGLGHRSKPVFDTRLKKIV